MPGVQMSLGEVMAELEKYGSEKMRAFYTRYGAGEYQFGVKMGDIRIVANALKRNHPLALELWATGNSDAQVLATFLMAPKQLDEDELDEMARPITYHRPLDELACRVVVLTPHVRPLRERWWNDPSEVLARAGWHLLVWEVGKGGAKGLDLDALLTKIEAEMKAAPVRKQETMNRCLVEIGIKHRELAARCIALGEKIGDMPSLKYTKGCISSYAPDWIRSVINPGSVKPR
jgi:3-methyladenine DNA glycosylase AlkD